jgi:ribonuclease Z
MLVHENSRFRDVSMMLSSHAYRGRSIGSVATCHQFPGYDIAFDIGYSSPESTAIGNVFVTHGHDDHIGGLWSHFLRRSGYGMTPPVYYMQPQDVNPTKDLIKAAGALNRSRNVDVDIIPVEEGERIPTKNGWSVIPFKATHRIPCFGYGVWNTRRRLKPEFQGASRDTLVQAKAQGIDLNETFDFPEIAFPGDTNLTILNRPAGDVVRKARLLLLECTFIDDEVSPAQTRKTGHVHVEDFLAELRQGTFENETILLTHFSARYKPKYIRDTMTRLLKDFEGVGPRIELLL